MESVSFLHLNPMLDGYSFHMIYLFNYFFNLQIYEYDKTI